MKTVVVTGAAGGIGKAIAVAFDRASWRVIALDKFHFSAVSSTMSTHAIDLSAADAAQQLSSLFEDVGTINAVVNNAAVQVTKPLIDTSIEEWESLFAVNLRGPFIVIRAAHPFLKQTRGSIVNVSSVHAVATSERVAAYAASKGGLLSLTRAAALELATDGIRVNAVLPGAIDTPMLHDGVLRLTTADRAATALEVIARKTPLGRIGSPDEVADAVVFLAGEHASFITGQALIVDGGAAARLSSESAN